MPKPNTETVLKLREQSGYGLSDCVMALGKCKGDLVLAKEFLRLHGMAVNMWRTVNGERVPTSPAREFLRKHNLLGGN